MDNSANGHAFSIVAANVEYHAVFRFFSDRGHLLEFAELSANADFGVITQKDAVKMRERWPDGFEEPIVANLEVVWECGEVKLRHALDTAIAGCAR